MKLLISTPAFGGLITSRYLTSMVETIRGLLEDGIPTAVYTLENESLISRARNRCAMYAIENGFDKMLFIDADMIWTYNDVKRLLNSDKPIVGGTYPLKAFPITLNFNPLPEKGFELFDRNREFDNFKEFAAKHADPETGEVEVKHIPTGFMRIDSSALDTLSKTVDMYMSYDPVAKELKKFFDFFPVRIVDHNYESEDWAFCTMARAAGIPIYLNTKIVTGHTGTHHYQIGQHVILGQKPLL